MPLPKTFHSKSQAALDKKAVAVLASEISSILKKQNRAVLCIPGGRSVVGIFSLLRNERRIPWRNVHIFMADERRVPVTDAESNFALANKTFIASLVKQQLLPESNVHPFVLKGSAADSVKSYNREFMKQSGRCDIVLLSSGEDGHVASLYPSHPSIRDSSAGYILVGNSPKPPAKRISMSSKLIASSKVAIILFFGDAKRDAYRAFKSKTATVLSCPAKLALKAKKCYIFTNLKN